MPPTETKDAQSEELKKYFIAELQDLQQFGEKTAKELFDLQIQNSYARIEFNKHIITTSVAIIGYSFVVISSNKADFNTNYLLTGIVFLVVLLILMLSNLREILDKDANGLEIERLKYQEALDEKKNLIIKYLQLPTLSSDSFQEYSEEIQKLPGLQRLTKEEEERQKLKEENFAKLNYFGELLTLLFLSGIFFISLAMLKTNLNWPTLILSSSVIILISFNDIATISKNLLNEAIYFLKKLKK